MHEVIVTGCCIAEASTDITASDAVERSLHSIVEGLSNQFVTSS